MKATILLCLSAVVVTLMSSVRSMPQESAKPVLQKPGSLSTGKGNKRYQSERVTIANNRVQRKSDHRDFTSRHSTRKRRTMSHGRREISTYSTTTAHPPPQSTIAAFNILACPPNHFRDFRSKCRKSF